MRSNIEGCKTVPGWVSLKERLPQKPGKYLVAWRYGPGAEEYFGSSLLFWTENGWDLDEDKDWLLVEYWMEIPELPEGQWFVRRLDEYA